MKRIETHRDLVVWQKAVALAGRIYVATRHLPKEELHGLNCQLRRAAVSIPAAIAEGSARGSRAEFVLLLQTARAALCELETQMTIALQQRLVPSELAALEYIAEVAGLIDEKVRKLATARRDAHAIACQPFAPK
jgi:four helix bundle protein